MGEGGHRLQACAASAQAWPDECAFVATNSSTQSFIQEPSPQRSLGFADLSGTLSHASARERAIISNNFAFASATLNGRGRQSPKVLPSPVLRSRRRSRMGEGPQSGGEGSLQQLLTSAIVPTKGPHPSEALASQSCRPPCNLNSTVCGIVPEAVANGRRRNL